MLVQKRNTMLPKDLAEERTGRIFNPECPDPDRIAKNNNNNNNVHL